jgi:thymidylate synthase (FAD)
MKTTRVPILDHGYVEFIEHYGSDERIVEAARMSTNKGFRTWEPYKECTDCGLWVLNTNLDTGLVSRCIKNDGDHSWQKKPRGDQGLLKYMWSNKHATPFEMAGLIIEVKAPIFVYRQWHRHRTQSYNEMSGRYTPLPNDNYIPTLARCMANANNPTKNKQARAAGDVILTEENAAMYLQDLEAQYKEQERFYQWSLGIGIPKELARCHVGVARYSKMRAAANLRNWLAFLTLRADSHAQWEIQQPANVIASFIEELYPRTYELFVGPAKKAA